MVYVTDSIMDEIYEKARNGEEHTSDEIIYLYDQADLNEVGKIAGAIARDISGNHVSFVSNMILNYTNVCNVRCKFCAFYRTGKEPDSYLMSRDEVIREIETHYSRFGIRQLLIQGGVNPNLDLDYYTDLFSEIHNRFPGLGIHGLSTSELSFIARKSKLSIESLLKKLRESGLETIPGAGAEIFDDGVRKLLGRPKGSGEEWLRIMETAHSMGIRTSATMMFGHVEESRHKADHLLSILRLQRKYGGFLSFTPWNFEPGKTELLLTGKVKNRCSSQDVLRNIAISRIVLNRHLPVIQTSWLTNGVQMGQMAIMFGANDWGGTIYNEKVIPATGKDVGNLRKDVILKAISQIGMVPVERDNLYHIVHVYQD